MNGKNFLDWQRNLGFVLKQEGKAHVLETPIPPVPGDDATGDAIFEYTTLRDDSNDVTCLMLATMTPEYQIQFEKQEAYEIMKQLKEMFQVQARVEKYHALGNATQCKMQDGTPVSSHLLKMKGYFDHLERLGMKFDVELQTDLIMLSLPPSFDSFISHFHMSDMQRTIPQLFGMLRTFESDMKPRYMKSRTSQVLAVGGKSPRNGNPNKKRKAKGNWVAPKPVAKGNKVAPKPVGKKTKDDKKCFHSN